MTTKIETPEEMAADRAAIAAALREAISDPDATWDTIRDFAALLEAPCDALATGRMAPRVAGMSSSERLRSRRQ